MPKNIKYDLLLLTLFLFASCSLFEKKGLIGSDKTKEQKEDAADIALAAVKRKLDALTAEARKSGDYAIDYLASDLYIKANDASIKGDSQTAAFLYEYVIKLRSDDFIEKKYAIELVKAGNLDRAEKVLAKLFKKNKYRDESMGLILASIYSALNKGKKARKIYRTILARNKKNEEACIFLTKSYIQEKKFKVGNKILDNCYKKNKKAVYIYYKGKIALERERLKQAQKYFKQALKIERNFYQAAIGLGVIHEEKKEYEKAAKVYKSYLKKDSANYVVLVHLVQIMFSLGEFKKVIPHLEKLVGIDQGNVNLKVKLGILYSDDQKYEKAIEIFNTVLQAHPDSDQVLYYLGSLYRQIQSHEQAVVYFSRISPDGPLFNDSVLQTAGTLLTMAKDGKATEEFIKFVEEKSQKIKALTIELSLLLTGYYEGISNYPKAISVLEDMKEEKGFGEGHQYYLASLYEKNKDYKKAHAIIEGILKKDPENPHALNFLGYSLLEIEGDLDKAYYYIKKAVDLQPNDGFIKDSLGWYYYKKGDLKRALKEIKEAWKQIKDDVVIAKHLAIIYKDLKNYKMAKKYYQEALKHCRFKTEKEDVLKAIKSLDELRKPAKN